MNSSHVCFPLSQWTSRNVTILTGTLTGVPLVVSVDIYLDSQGFGTHGKEINAICAPVWGHHEPAVHSSKFSSTCKCDFVVMVVVYIQSPTCLSGVVHILSHPWAAALSCCYLVCYSKSRMLLENPANPGHKHILLSEVGSWRQWLHHRNSCFPAHTALDTFQHLFRLYFLRI